MWNDFVGKAYSRADFAAYVASLTWTAKVWNPQRPQMPKGIVLHNTAAPTLAQWAESGPKHAARIRNLRDFYEKQQHWHGGPHLFVSRDWITVFDGLLEHGTHSPSFNAGYFGIEMVGNYDIEEFDSGDGAKVRDNTAFAAAILCHKFGWEPDAKLIRLHKEDPETKHACPGRKVDKLAMIARIRAALAELKGQIPAPVVSIAAPSPRVTDDMRRRMVLQIYGDEARRDTNGKLRVYMLPKGDGGGTYEIAGINDRYHPQEAAQLRALIRAGKQDEAERGVQDYYLRYTNAVADWTDDAGLEYWLRSAAFNRGPVGAATTLQMALGVTEDGDVGPQTKKAVRAIEDAAGMDDFFGRMRAARERYEREEVKRNEKSKFWRGLVNRWNKELTAAREFHAEQQKLLAA